MKIKAILQHNYVSIYVNFGHRVRSYIATGIKLGSPDEWRDGAVVGRKDAERINKKIRSKLVDVERLLSLMELQGIQATPERLSDALSKNERVESFVDFMALRIEERELKPNTCRNAVIVLKALKRFGKIKSFASLTSSNVALFDSFLRKEDRSRSEATIHGYHKCVKTYVNEAVMLGKIKESPYKFFKDKKPSPPERHPLTQSEIELITNARLPKIYEKAQDIFIFQAYTGLSYADAMKFDASINLIHKDGYRFISFKRTKTSTLFYTPLLPAADVVILKYGDKLPRLSNQKYNMYLHAIAAIVGIEKHLTSHLARHSFATLMLSHNIPIAVVAKMLGHKDISVTQIYAKILDEKVVESSRKLFEEL